MEKHEHLILKCKFSGRWLCHFCAQEFVENKKHEEEILLNLYNIIDNDGEPFSTTEAIVFYIKNRLKSLAVK